METNIFKNEKQRKLFFKNLNKALRPLKKALIAFKISMEKVDWEEINKLLKEKMKK